jgi:DNA-binding transcriptional regulator YdaS (Cro superfamily)
MINSPLTFHNHFDYTTTMELKLFLKGKNRADFAEQIGTTRNYVNLLACRIRRPSPALALRIEEATGGEVSRMELLYPDNNKEIAGE